MDPTTLRIMAGAAITAPPPVQISFSANRYYANYNESSTLSWQVLNSISVSINHIGSVGAVGSSVQTGSNTTRTYTLTALGLDGITYTSSLTITWAICPYIAYGQPEWC